MNKFVESIRENWVVAAMIGSGLALLIAGVWPMIVPEEPKVEIVRDETKEPAKIVIDVEGAVEKPGVYELQEGARIGQALIAAGGMSAGADRVWVARFVNLAEPVRDGMKVFIPEAGTVEGVETGSYGSPSYQGSVAGSAQGMVNINTASTTELESLWGIGEARAKDIVANRPYSSLDEVMSKAGVPSNVYERIKDEISLY